MSDDLLDPKNDYVFKRIFGEDPRLLAALINDLRPDLPEIRVVEILNPGINAEELRGKYIVLDVLARDAAGHAYNVEIQVRRYGAWHQRALYYLARMLGHRLEQGEDYGQLRAAVGIHLLDFDLFTETPAQCAQALWRFAMRIEPDRIEEGGPFGAGVGSAVWLGDLFRALARGTDDVRDSACADPGGAESSAGAERR